MFNCYSHELSKTNAHIFRIFTIHRVYEPLNLIISIGIRKKFQNEIKSKKEFMKNTGLKQYYYGLLVRRIPILFNTVYIYL